MSEIDDLQDLDFGRNWLGDREKRLTRKAAKSFATHLRATQRRRNLQSSLRPRRQASVSLARISLPESAE